MAPMVRRGPGRPVGRVVCWSVTVVTVGRGRRDRPVGGAAMPGCSVMAARVARAGRLARGRAVPVVPVGTAVAVAFWVASAGPAGWAVMARPPLLPPAVPVGLAVPVAPTGRCGSTRAGQAVRAGPAGPGPRSRRAVVPARPAPRAFRAVPAGQAVPAGRPSGWAVGAGRAVWVATARLAVTVVPVVSVVVWLLVGPVVMGGPGVTRELAGSAGPADCSGPTGHRPGRAWAVMVAKGVTAGPGRPVCWAPRMPRPVVRAARVATAGTPVPVALMARVAWAVTAVPVVWALTRPGRRRAPPAVTAVAAATAGLAGRPAAGVSLAPMVLVGMPGMVATVAVGRPGIPPPLRVGPAAMAAPAAPAVPRAAAVRGRRPVTVPAVVWAPTAAPAATARPRWAVTAAAGVTAVTAGRPATPVPVLRAPVPRAAMPVTAVMVVPVWPARRAATTAGTGG